MNLVEIAGFLGSDAEERFTANGKRVVSFRVATKVRQGGKDETIWWRVNIWGDRFDKLIPYLRKGTGIILLGEMSKPETYVDKEGKTQVSLTITAEIIKFSPFGKPDKAQESGNQSPQFATASVSHATEGFSSAGFNDSTEMAGKGAFSGGYTPSDFSNDDLPF